MKIPVKGKKPASILKDLAGYKSGDIAWEDGRSFGHAFIGDRKGRELVEQAYNLYLWENALDPTLYPSLMQLENELISMVAGHLGGGNATVGTFTSGGTESIMLAAKAARDRSRAERPAPGVPEMILPVTAHPAFHKACAYFDIKPVTVGLSPDFRVDVEAVKNAISENTIMLVGSAVCYAYGVTDPIAELGKLADEKDLWLHVDGCIGAFLLPWFRRLGSTGPAFDLSTPGVSSISVDFHKYAFSPKGASAVLYRDRSLRRWQIFTHTNWVGYTIINPTMQSSRSGGALAAAWAALQYYGDEGYLEICRGLKEASEKIAEAIRGIPELELLGEPEMSLIGGTGNGVDVFELVEQMRGRGWHVQAQLGLADYRETFHLTVLPNNLPLIDRFLADLTETVADVKKRGVGAGGGRLQAALSGIDWEKLSYQQLEDMLDNIGLDGDEPPENMAEINRILNVLPPQITDRLMVAYYNKAARLIIGDEENE